MPISDDPSEEQAKDVLDDLHPALLWAKRAWESWDKADRGFVAWDQNPPAGIGYHLHKFSILDAFMTALAFCQTHAMNEWLLLGQSTFAVVRTLPQFVEDDPVESSECPLVYVGRLGNIRVFLAPHDHENEFCAGVPGKDGPQACRGTINHPIAHFQPNPAQAGAGEPPRDGYG